MSLTSSYVNPYLSPSYNPGFFNSLGMSGADEIKNWNPTGILQQKWNQPRERARLAKEYSDPISKEDYASLNLSTPWNDNMTEGDAFAILQVERTRNFDEKALFHAGLSGGTVRGLGMLGTRLSASMVDPVSGSRLLGNSARAHVWPG